MLDSALDLKLPPMALRAAWAIVYRSKYLMCLMHKVGGIARRRSAADLWYHGTQPCLLYSAKPWLQAAN